MKLRVTGGDSRDVRNRARPAQDLLDCGWYQFGVVRQLRTAIGMFNQRYAPPAAADSPGTTDLRKCGMTYLPNNSIACMVFSCGIDQNCIIARN
jgi:hypothetical protein